MHWKTSPLARRSKELKGTPLGGAVEQMNRFAARQSYRVHEDVLSNPESRSRFEAQRPELDARQREVFGGLEGKGLSIVPLTDFFPEADQEQWTELRARGDDFIERVEAEREKRLAKEAKKGRKKGLGKGDYIMRLLGKDVPTLAADDPWLRLGVSDRMLDVVNSYFGLWSKLTYVDLWYTPPAEPGVERVSSQRWHRDYNDARLVKVFIYLTDVDEDTGPLEFVMGSTPNGEYGNVWPWRPVSNDLYPPEDEFERRIPKSAQVALTAPEGSMIFCNTSGFHRGGFATEKPRNVWVYNYVSPAALIALVDRNFDIGNGALGDLSEVQRFALT